MQSFRLEVSLCVAECRWPLASHRYLGEAVAALSLLLQQLSVGVQVAEGHVQHRLLPLGGAHGRLGLTVPPLAAPPLCLQGESGGAFGLRRNQADVKHVFLRRVETYMHLLCYSRRSIVFSSERNAAMMTHITPHTHILIQLPHQHTHTACFIPSARLMTCFFCSLFVQCWEFQLYFPWSFALLRHQLLVLLIFNQVYDHLILHRGQMWTSWEEKSLNLCNTTKGDLFLSVSFTLLLPPTSLSSSPSPCGGGFMGMDVKKQAVFISAVMNWTNQNTTEENGFHLP